MPDSVLRMEIPRPLRNMRRYSSVDATAAVTKVLSFAVRKQAAEAT